MDFDHHHFSSSPASSSLPERNNAQLDLDLDLDLDDALREAAALITAEHSSVMAQHPSDTNNFDPLAQFWPASETTPRHRHRHRASRPSINVPSDMDVDFPPIAPDQPHAIQRRGARVPESSYSSRVDLTARNTLRELIFSTLLNDALSPPQRAAILDDCKESAGQSTLGVPFPELISEPMEPLGVPPLLYELMSCHPDWEGINDDEMGTGMEVVEFLIEHWRENVLAHGKQGMLSWVVRTGCLRRFDQEEANRLYQQLRPIVFQRQFENGHKYAEYDISINQTCVSGSGADQGLGFNALISVHDFATHLTRLEHNRRESANDYEQRTSGRTSSFYRKPLPVDPALTRVGIEFLVAHRAWRLEVDSNALKLELLDISDGSSSPSDEAGLFVDARVRLVAPDIATFSDTKGAPSSDTGPIELLLPRALLRPISASGRGTHAVTLSPCFAPITSGSPLPRGFDDPQYLHDGTLLIELTVRLAADPFVDPPRPRVETISAPSVPQVLAVETAATVSANTVLPTKDDLDDLYIDDEAPVVVMGEAESAIQDEAESTVQNDAVSTIQDDSDGWEEIEDPIHETEEKDGGWVKASWSGHDEDL